MLAEKEGSDGYLPFHGSGKRQQNGGESGHAMLTLLDSRMENGV